MDWKANLPVRFQLTQQNIFARQGTRTIGPLIMLHLWHDMLQCELHRVVG